jgi:hypothetical protein
MYMYTASALYSGLAQARPELSTVMLIQPQEKN